MLKLKIFLTVLSGCFLFTLFGKQVEITYASSNSFVSVTNPIRGNESWDLKNQTPLDVVRGEQQILLQQKVPVTWLMRYDVFASAVLIDSLKNYKGQQELGLLLEITPDLARDSHVPYHQTESWHSAGSVFLTGYDPEQRKKLIDTSFERFHEVWGYYPQSVGAWWIDAFSLDYLQKKYGVSSALIVADQYSTDNYQIWGQYWSTPYYPTRQNALFPAQNLENKIPVVLVQWAARDPLNGYGKGVEESTYSVQPNDYIDYHDLHSDYFSSLIDIYTEQPLNKFGHVVVGLENTYSWNDYKDEYQKQIELLAQKRSTQNLQLVLMKDFAQWYKTSFPKLSPDHTIVAEDPLKTNKSVVWYMSPYYRIGVFFTENGSEIRDLRQYLESQQEPCLTKACNAINFATFATRVLDDVTYHQSWLIDPGKIHQIDVKRDGEKVVLTYKDQLDKQKRIEFLPRDVSLDEHIYSIDGAILTAQEQSKNQEKNENEANGWTVKSESFIAVFKSAILFLLLIVLGFFIPGKVVVKNIFPQLKQGHQSMALVTGMVLFTLISYLSGLIGLKYLPVFFCAGLCLWAFRTKTALNLNLEFLKGNRGSALIIICGALFQIIPTIKSGLLFNHGIGFWGPNSHDGVWHLALSHHLTRSIGESALFQPFLPLENPILSGTRLVNYHYFFDLLVGYSSWMTGISAEDLLFRGFPLLCSLLLGLTSLQLLKQITKNTLAIILSLYILYFGGSFGWIVEYLQQGHFGGESAFWVNQSISFNLNPPFAISLIIVFSIILCLVRTPRLTKKQIMILGLLIGSLIEFKAYAGILVLLTLGMIAVFELWRWRKLKTLLLCIGSAAVSLVLLLPNYGWGKDLLHTNGLFLFSPFWFVHSMVDAPDRVGWQRLTLARYVSLENKNWPKFFAAETLGLILFLVGNLGTRVVSLFGVLFFRKKNLNPTVNVLTLLSILSFVIPLLFIQRGNPWNTIQFFYYGLYIMALLSGVVFVKLTQRMPFVLRWLVIGLIVILTPINAITTARSYFQSSAPDAYISSEEIKALKFLSQQPKGSVLTFPYLSTTHEKFISPYPLLSYETSAYVSAYSAQPTFIEDTIQQDILQTGQELEKNSARVRVASAKKFFFSNDSSIAVKFLEDNAIKYIYLPKVLKPSVNLSISSLELLFENSETVIYKVK